MFLIRLLECIRSSEPLLITFVISIELSCAGYNIKYLHFFVLYTTSTFEHQSTKYFTEFFLNINFKPQRKHCVFNIYTRSTCNFCNRANFISAQYLDKNERNLTSFSVCIDIDKIKMCIDIWQY